MAYSLVTHIEAGGTADSVTTGSVDTTGATFLVLNVAQYSNGSYTVSDSKSNSWTQLTKYTGGSNTVGSCLFYCVGGTVGTGHTFTASGSGIYPSMQVLAFTGQAASPFDTENGASGNASSLATGSVTPSENNELVIAGLAHENNSGASVTIDGGFTAYKTAYTGGNNEGGGIAYLIQTTATSANPTWNITNANYIAASIACFKAAAGGGSSVPVFVHHYRMQGAA